MDNGNDNNSTIANTFITQSTIIKDELQDILERIQQIEVFIRQCQEAERQIQPSINRTSMTNFYLPITCKEDSDEIGEPLQKKIKIKR